MYKSEGFISVLQDYVQLFGVQLENYQTFGLIPHRLILQEQISFNMQPRPFKPSVHYVYQHMSIFWGKKVQNQ